MRKSRLESVRRRADVQQALAEATHARPPAPRASANDRLVFAIALGVLGIAIAARYALRVPLVAGVLGVHAALIERLAMGVMFAALTVGVSRVIEVQAIGRVRGTASRYDLLRVLRLVTGIVLAFIAVSTLFANWTTAVVSLGLLSLILGFALQTPITSFIGWVYLMVKRPYRVGDRIKLGAVAGDVIAVDYLDTTLWEFGGEYLSTDHPSGRIIRFPNSIVLQEPVYNYSWPLFPYIWNEITLQVAYESDLELIAKIMLEVVEEDMGADMQERVKKYRALLERTPVDALDVKEKPTMVFRANSMTWIDATVRYVVHPKEAGRIKTRLIQKLLQRMRQHPEAILFPKSNAR